MINLVHNVLFIAPLHQNSFGGTIQAITITETIQLNSSVNVSQCQFTDFSTFLIYAKS